MCDAGEMENSPVGACPPGRAQHAVPAPSNNQQPTTNNAASFDAAKLHGQLAGLLKLYLARAADPDAIEKCSAKDAISCAKALTAMMSDLQSGKPASVNKRSTWPRMEIEANSGGMGVPPVIHPNPPARRRCHQIKTSTSILEDSLSAVLASTEESTIPEPYQRFIARADRLCKEVRKRLDAIQSEDSSSPADDRRLKTGDCFT